MPLGFAQGHKHCRGKLLFTLVNVSPRWGDSARRAPRLPLMRELSKIYDF